MKKVPEFLYTDDLKAEEYKIIAALVPVTAMNYTTFRETTCFYLLFIAPIMYMNRKFLAENQFDPYTRNPATDDPSHVQSAFTWDLVIILFLIFAHYASQRDLLVMSIEKNIIKRH